MIRRTHHLLIQQVNLNDFICSRKKSISRVMCADKNKLTEHDSRQARIVRLVPPQSLDPDYRFNKVPFLPSHFYHCARLPVRGRGPLLPAAYSLIPHSLGDPTQVIRCKCNVIGFRVGVMVSSMVRIRVRFSPTKNPSTYVVDLPSYVA